MIDNLDGNLNKFQGFRLALYVPMFCISVGIGTSLSRGSLHVNRKV